MRIVGIDPSLTATGIACTCGTSVFSTKKRGPERLFEISREVLSHATGVCTELGLHPGIVVIEGYSFNSKFKSEFMGELGGCIRMTLWTNRIPYVDIPPAVLKKFATGKGNAPKDAMIAAAIRTFGFKGSNNNEADAFLLETMGRHAFWRDETELLRGMPTTAYMREAVGKVEWPEAAA